ncbi:glycosyltransferase family 4 protein [Niabella hibiscisoli]|uniref:glycosyltransferase family 4 protein n=1 Tax=Niabella hibiscisoli TaxID=1825928 RepID=UPI001F0E46B8|nr:glycosyltransferase family 4 protein [Niabella hibiscisoli]MCH5720652.1 glycosyltransferase family 4 protein [Niabella hibiscisoli]
MLSKYFTGEGYNILHLNSLLQRTIGDLAKEYDYKIVLTLHVSLWRVFFNNNKQSFIEKWASKNFADQKTAGLLSMKEEEKMCLAADRIICLTEESKEFISDYYKVNECKTKIIPNGLIMSNTAEKNEMGEMRRSLGFAPTDFIFIYVGRLIEQKGIGVLLEAFKKIAKRSGSIKLLVVGSGNTDTFLSRIFECCGQITFTGYQPVENLSKLYKIANCGVMPSTTEQSSFVVLEMLSKKLPVILSDISAFNKFEHEKHVTKVKTDDRGYVFVDLLYKAMKHIFEDATYKARIAGNGYQLFLDQYQASTMAEKTYDVYKQVIALAPVTNSIQ